MINIVVELSKYVILTLMIVYTVLCYYLVVGKHASDRKGLLRSQITLTFFLDFTAFVVIFLKTFDFKVVIFYAEMMIYFAAILILYRRIYKNASMLLLNNMCMLLSVGFIMLCRLDIASANKQLLIVACGSAVALVIPVMIRKMKFLKDLTWVYAGLGIVLLGAVLVLAQTSYGAKLSLMGIQPSEVIKLTFVFFMASLLAREVTFKKVVLATVVACGNPGAFKRSWKRCNLFCSLSGADLCINQEAGIPLHWNCRRYSRRCSGISPVWSCKAACQCVERSYGSLSE